MDCLFCKIVKKEIDAKICYEDENIIGFEDINPQAPVHLLIIPKLHIATTNDVTSDHNDLIGQLIQAAKQLAIQYNVASDGYRLVLNCLESAGQSVFHLHLHLLGGRQMMWPPG